jgi:hypothetical protein
MIFGFLILLVHSTTLYNLPAKSPVLLQALRDLRHVCLSFLPYGTTGLSHSVLTAGLSLDWFSWNAIFESSSNIWQEKTIIIKAGTYNGKKTFVYLRKYLVELFSDWRKFQTKLMEKVKIHVLCSISSSRKPYRIWENVWKIWYSQTGQRRPCNTAHEHCMLDN